MQRCWGLLDPCLISLSSSNATCSHDLSSPPLFILFQAFSLSFSKRLLSLCSRKPFILSISPLSFTHFEAPKLFWTFHSINHICNETGMPPFYSLSLLILCKVWESKAHIYPVPQSPYIAECLHIRSFVMFGNKWMIFLPSAYLFHLNILIAAKEVSLASKSDELSLLLNALEWLEG